MANSTRTFESSRGLLREDLKDRVTFDVDIMDKFLRVPDVEHATVVACKAKCATSAVQKHFFALETALSDEREKLMYEPLVSSPNLLSSSLIL